MILLENEKNENGTPHFIITKHSRNDDENKYTGATGCNNNHFFKECLLHAYMVKSGLGIHQ
jgi:hypothetical protein